ncbi:Csu type fimbrial protein [Phyllobacterium lublinensis]|uniref:Csu type fimbrial protein n=1 Tax=Phyllobacterium lublinensis TaxID=2875708 RepID=UPI001CCF8904|nr:spore coat protein U domain-containing protein [Phyllobacterium sp. 2063]MBZ9653492.1 spore coat protein U domain-containing protein [Phyllobacterium sp. 2063]
MCLFVLFLASDEASADTRCVFRMSDGDFDFGALDPLAARQFDQAAKINAECVTMVPFSVLGLFTQPVRACMKIGSGSGGADTNWRYMVGPNGKKIRYQLYGSPKHVDPYEVGNYVGNNFSLAFRILSLFEWVPSSTSFDIHGWIPDQAGLEEGYYIDMVQAELIYTEVSIFTASGCNLNGAKSAKVTFPVRVQVKPYCALEVSQHIDFGTWQDLDQPRDQEGRVKVNCDTKTPYSLKLGWGDQGEAGKSRNMISGKEKISYNLFRDRQRTQLWGDQAGNMLANRTGTGSPVEIPVYARVPKQPTPSSGTYMDHVVVTLEYQ